MKLVNIGFGSMVAAGRGLGIVAPGSGPPPQRNNPCNY